MSKKMRRQHKVHLLPYIAACCFYQMAEAQVTIDGVSDPIVLGSKADEAPILRPLDTCTDRSKIYDNDSFRKFVSDVLFAEVGYSLKDSSPFPNILIVEECGDLLVVSTVLGSMSFSRQIRIFFEKSDFLMSFGAGKEPSAYSIIVY